MLTWLGLTEWPDAMRQAITDPDGSEVTLAAALNRQGYWQPTDARKRRVNVAGASERLAVSEFNTWYVAGLAARLEEEGGTRCRVYRAATPKRERIGCSAHEGQIYALAEIIRSPDWLLASPWGAWQASIPAGPGCHHTIERVEAELSQVRRVVRR